MNEQLIKDYYAGMTYDALCQKYHHRFSTIKKILSENKVDLKNRSRKKYISNKDINEEIIQKICNNYKEGRSLNWLSKTFSINKEKIRKILVNNGIKIRKSSPHKYTMNFDYFDEIKENQAYILGLFAADGWIRERDNLLEISLQQSDEQILEDIRIELSLSRQLRHFTDSKNRKMVSLTFSSEKIKQIFEIYGNVPRKTFKLLHLPPLTDDIMIHYIRGYFDGDGSASNGFNITSANLSFLQEIQSFLERKYKIQPGKIYIDTRKNTCYSFNYGKKDDIEKIYKALYPVEEILCLKRKQNKLKSFIMK